MLYGSVAFGPSIDLFSFGVILAELSGCNSFRDMRGGGWSAVGYGVALMEQLGTPLGNLEVTGLPLFPKKPPNFRPRPFPAAVIDKLGAHGSALLSGCLCWEPSGRWTAQRCLTSSFINPGRFDLGGVLQAHRPKQAPYNARPLLCIGFGSHRSLLIWGGVGAVICST